MKSLLPLLLLLSSTKGRMMHYGSSQAGERSSEEVSNISSPEDITRAFSSILPEEHPTFFIYYSDKNALDEFQSKFDRVVKGVQKKFSGLSSKKKKKLGFTEGDFPPLNFEVVVREISTVLGNEKLSAEDKDKIVLQLYQGTFEKAENVEQLQQIIQKTKTQPLVFLDNFKMGTPDDLTKLLIPNEETGLSTFEEAFLTSCQFHSGNPRRVLGGQVLVYPAPGVNLRHKPVYIRERFLMSLHLALPTGELLGGRFKPVLSREQLEAIEGLEKLEEERRNAEKESLAAGKAEEELLREKQRQEDQLREERLREQQHIDAQRALASVAPPGEPVRHGSIPAVTDSGSGEEGTRRSVDSRTSQLGPQEFSRPASLRGEGSELHEGGRSRSSSHRPEVSPELGGVRQVSRPAVVLPNGAAARSTDARLSREREVPSPSPEVERQIAKELQIETWRKMREEAVEKGKEWEKRKAASKKFRRRALNLNGYKAPVAIEVEKPTIVIYYFNAKGPEGRVESGVEMMREYLSNVGDVEVKEENLYELFPSEGLPEFYSLLTFIESNVRGVSLPIAYLDNYCLGDTKKVRETNWSNIESLIQTATKYRTAGGLLDSDGKSRAETHSAVHYKVATRKLALEEKAKLRGTEGRGREAIELERQNELERQDQLERRSERAEAPQSVPTNESGRGNLGMSVHESDGEEEEEGEGEVDQRPLSSPGSRESSERSREANNEMLSNNAALPGLASSSAPPSGLRAQARRPAAVTQRTNRGRPSNAVSPQGSPQRRVQDPPSPSGPRGSVVRPAVRPSNAAPQSLPNTAGRGLRRAGPPLSATAGVGVNNGNSPRPRRRPAAAAASSPPAVRERRATAGSSPQGSRVRRPSPPQTGHRR